MVIYRNPYHSSIFKPIDNIWNMALCDYSPVHLFSPYLFFFLLHFNSCLVLSVAGVSCCTVIVSVQPPPLFCTRYAQISHAFAHCVHISHAHSCRCFAHGELCSCIILKCAFFLQVRSGVHWVSPMRGIVHALSFFSFYHAPNSEQSTT